MRALQPYVRRRSDPRCELCGETIAEQHAHVVEVLKHTLLCACTACAILFRDSGGRFRTVPERVTPVDVPDVEFPVEIAFFVRRGGWVAFYPSPAGPVEAPVPDGAALPAIAEEVEALLLHRPRNGRARAFIVPIDLCYRLVGSLRQHWRGPASARSAIEEFLAQVSP